MALKLKSERQIQAEILARLISKLGLNDVNPGSVSDVITQAVAQQDFALYYQIAQVSRLVDIDYLTGADLDNKAFEYGLSRVSPQKAKGTITIFRPSGFQKVSTTFYAGAPAPIVGDTFIDVNDASSLLIGSSGTLILGRGSNNEEQVSYVTAPTNNVTSWRIQLTTTLTKDHAVEESVILKQGNDEFISAGTIIIVPPTGVSAEIRFETDNDVVLLAGEDKIVGNEITAVVPGTDGNISVGAISGEAAFPNSPFPGARAKNESKITTGIDLESDDELRDRIKNYVQGVTRAVKQAIYNAIVGLVDPETAKRVVSASIILPIEEAGDVKVYIDDGQGFEPSFKSQGFENVLKQSTSGEQRLQIDRFPIVKAQVESNSAEPYNMSSGPLALNFIVGNVAETVTFNPGDFRFPEITSAEEIVAVLNNRSNLIEARTSQIGRQVLITSKSDVNETIRVTGGSANSLLNFPMDEKVTLNLYVDDVKLSKDGQTALLDSLNSSPYNLDIVGPFPHKITMVVDGKIANPQTATLNVSDVVNTAAVTVAEICEIINRDISGIEAIPIDNNSKVRIISLTKLSNKSKIHITGGSLNNSSNGLGMSISEVSGINGDYVLNRELGIVQLREPLKANQSVTVGSQFTRANFISVSPELYSPLGGETLVISVDGGADQLIIFDGTFAAGKTASETALFLNQDLRGATASVKTIGGLKYLQIASNTYNINGSLRIKSASTANASFGFPLNVTTSSSVPNKAYLESGMTGPFEFVEDDTIVIVANNDIVNSTYAVPLNYASTITAQTSTTQFSAQSLTSVFSVNNELSGYYVSFKGGANTDSGVIDQVTNQFGGFVKYTFNPAPSNMAIFAVGDLLKVTDLEDTENDGHFSISSIGSDFVIVENPGSKNATSQNGTGTLSQRRKISSYSNMTGELIVSTSFTNAPIIGDESYVIPSTVSNVVNFLNNTKITALSLKVRVEGSSGHSRIQLSSKLEGSDGYIQVTGGSANTSLNFSTLLFRGLAAYSYWTGLLALVHKTIYGDDADLGSYPGYGAAGITFRVLAPTVQQLAIELDVTLADGISISSLENDIKSAVTGYVNTLGVGKDVIIERIRAAVISISGIVDVVINSPTANIAISDNELAKVSDTDVLIG